MLGEPALARLTTSELLAFITVCEERQTNGARLVAVIPRPVRTAFRHIRRLNERGLIRLSSSAVDRRITIVTLTEQGEGLRESIFREEQI